MKILTHVRNFAGKCVCAFQIRNSYKSLKNILGEKYYEDSKSIAYRASKAYVHDCIFKNKSTFDICYGMKYRKCDNFVARFCGYTKYAIDRIIGRKKYYLLEPLYLKFAECPNEFLLGMILSINGFCVENEDITLTSIKYTVATI